MNISMGTQLKARLVIGEECILDLIVVMRSSISSTRKGLKDFDF
jgi:hypothetical protein